MQHKCISFGPILVDQWAILLGCNGPCDRRATEDGVQITGLVASCNMRANQHIFRN